jgi:hypothetical protein
MQLSSIFWDITLHSLLKVTYHTLPSELVVLVYEMTGRSCNCLVRREEVGEEMCVFVQAVKDEGAGVVERNLDSRLRLRADECLEGACFVP